MTNAQKWVAAFLVLFVLLLIIGKITEPDDFDTSGKGNYASDASPKPGDLDAGTLIKNLNCTSCHGVDLKGGKSGPSLHQVGKYWDRDDLINYFRNPSSYKGDERFESYKSVYPGVVMPSFGNIDVKNLGTIADHLLSLKEAE